MSQLACDFFDDASLHAELRRLKDARNDRAQGHNDVERQLLEERFLQRARAEVASLAGRAPSDAARFIVWFARLAHDSELDPLFPWLADEATIEQFRWFLRQEVAGESGLPDLARLDRELALDHSIEPVPEAIALANLHSGLTFNRRYAFHAVGALAVIERTAPRRSAWIGRALERLGLAGLCEARLSNTWHELVITQLVAEAPACRFAIAEGALMRLTAGERCFERYRFLLGVPR